MINIEKIINGFGTAESRWARFGPYYAMFPLDFAFDIVNTYSKKGEYIIDPFAGRGSSIYAAGVLGRQGLGIEINPVGWLYGSVKLRPAIKKLVLGRLSQIYSIQLDYNSEIEKLHDFFRMCYCDKVLAFLLSARDHLNWKTNEVDATLMSILLLYLHGKLGEGFSNQMRMTRAMGINYSINWWKKHNFIQPPVIDPFDFMSKRIEWRYAKGIPNITESYMILGDSAIELCGIVKRAKKNDIKFSLLFTSPPYNSVTDYHTDQWLRLWLLGGTEGPKSLKQKHKGRFVSKEDYYNLLDNVFGNCAEIMDKKSTIYVRTDTREFTFNSTLKILKKYFPKHRHNIIPKPFIKKTQTEIHGNKSKIAGEIDIVLTK